MSDDRGTLERLAGELALLLSPVTSLTPSAAPAFLLELGLPLTPAQANSVAPALTQTVSAIGKLLDLDVQLSAAVEINDSGLVIEKRIAALDQVRQVIAGFEQLKTGLNGLGLPGAGSIIADLPRRLFDLLLATYLSRSQGVNQLLEFTGVLERVDHNVGVFDPATPFFTTNTFHFGRIGGWLRSPTAQLEALYDWGKPGFDGTKLLATIDRMTGELGFPALFDTTAAPSLDLAFFELVARTDVNPRGIELRLHQGLTKAAMQLGHGRWTATLALDTNVPTGTTVLLQPGTIAVKPPDATNVAGKLGVTYAYRREANDPLFLLSLAENCRISIEEVAASAAVVLRPGGQAELEFRADLKRGRVFIDTGKADGFIATILGGFQVDQNFDLGVGLSGAEGVHFHGSSTLEIQLASHVSLGPIELTALTLLIGIEGGKFPIGIATDLKASLGPLVAIVQGLGVEAVFVLVDNHDGNAGPVDVQPRFKPPKGIGLSIDAGVVRGGGYLFFDAGREEYAGALELDFLGIVTIKAIGLLTTRMPDGSKGFSLLIIMSVEFATGIQLGFGFTLVAVGGLLGVNRTMSLQALAEGIRSGAIESVMFPRDIIANAPKIISDLRAFFPPKEGTFLIGPMVKLGWGTPTLVSLAMGVIIEIPGNIAIVGILQIALPTVDAALIKLQVNFMGAIEFDKKRIWFYAVLFDSRVLFLTIEGGMGLLVAFGDDANFVVSVGGFHPRFSPPALPFPSPTRITINILNTPVARVRVLGYFAVTSNTAQFGARVEVFFGLSILNVEGHLAFDALFQFSPFYFIIEISASMSVNVFGAGLFSVSLRGTLEGPAPWHIEGHGSLTILFWDIDVDFSETWGENKKEELPPIPVLPLLQGELDKSDNWRAFLPQGVSLRVSLRKMPEAEAALILHPVGLLRVSQRAVPLDLKLDKVGTRKPSDVNRLGLSVVGGGLAKKADAVERFAPAQYQNFSDSDKLSRPAFGPEHSGLELSASGDDFRSSTMARRTVRYEEIIIDSNYKRFRRRFRTYSGTLFQFFLNGAAVTKCEFSRAAKRKLQPFDDKITVQTETYTVAFQASNKAFSSDTVAFHSEASARDYMDSQIAADPSLSDQIHVIPGFERAA